jgi:chromatin remodeling complex protein RSC6
LKPLEEKVSKMSFPWLGSSCKNKYNNDFRKMKVNDEDEETDDAEETTKNTEKNIQVGKEGDDEDSD